MLFCEHKCLYKTVTPPPEVVFPATSEQPHHCPSKRSWKPFHVVLETGREPDNHSEAAAFGYSPGKFKPRKFAKTDVVVRYADCLV
ncbi:hypothetical protein E2C01_094175 [Portunus trituberculatus]|uniref:Uncharacterized protein n=1 Tax=Portunus trituberculatus TaxID=210409 RepID=A0A5B7JWG7_PORTR|nr:hypothetical protein [Portunus trituberculatus]